MPKSNSVRIALTIGLLGLATSSNAVIVAADEDGPQSRVIAPPISRSNLPQVLNFELPRTDAPPQGWSGTPPSTVFSDPGEAPSGHNSVRIERHPGDPMPFSTVTTFIPIDFLGQTVELRGFLRTRDVSEFAGLWIREDGYALRSLAFDNMQDRSIKGTTDWKQYDVVLDVPQNATGIFFGVLLSGTGTVWLSEAKFEIVGPNVLPTNGVAESKQDEPMNLGFED